MSKYGRGTKAIFLIVALAAAAALAFMMRGGNDSSPRPRDSARQPAADQGAPNLPGQDLKVLSLTPQGEVDRVQQIAVVFNQPMVALGDYETAADAPPVMELKPQLPGVFRWLNQYTLVFVPERPLVGSQDVELTVRAGVTSLGGAKLSADHKASFSLPDIALNERAMGGWASQPLRPELTLAFNQPVDTADLGKKLKFRYELEGLEQTVKAEVVPVKLTSGRLLEDKSLKASARFMIKPAADLRPGADFTAVIEAGLISAAGPRLSRAEMVYNGSTYQPLAVSSLDGLWGASYHRAFSSAVNDGRRNPEGGLVLRFNNPVKYGELLRAVKIRPDYDLSRARPYEDDSFDGYYDSREAEDGAQTAADAAEGAGEKLTNGLMLPGPLKPNTRYEVAISPRLTDIYGQTLGNDHDSDFMETYETGPFPPLLNLPGREGVLETASPPIVAVFNRNLKSIEVKGLALSPAEVIPFLNRGGSPYGDGCNKDCVKIWGRVNSASAERLLTLAPAKGSELGAEITPLRLDRLFESSELRGKFLFVNLSSPEVLNYDGDVRQLIRQIQISDLAVSAKLGDASSLIWVTNVATGEPWPNAEVTIRNHDNQVVWQGRADRQGLAWAPGFGELSGNQPHYKATLYIFAQDQGQATMITTDWNDDLEPWQWGLNHRYVGRGAEPADWLINALPIYRPGEEVKFKLIHRWLNGDNYEKPASGTLVKISVRDARGEELISDEVAVSAFGTASFSFTLADTPSLGEYSVLLDDNWVGRFRVDNYRKPSFALTFEPLKDAYALGRAVSIQLQARYHFGLPVAERPVKYKVTREQATYSLPGWDAYTVGSMALEDNSRLDDSDSVITVSKGEDVLSRDGRFNLAFTAEPGLIPGPQSYNAEFTVMDVDTRTVSDRQRILVHPADYYVALKADNFMGLTGRPISISFLVATPGGTLKAGVKTRFTVYKRDWQTVRRKSLGSVYEFESNRVDEQVAQRELVSGSSPDKFEFTPQKSGYYLIKAEIVDERGRANQAAVDLYAYGAGPVGWPESNTDRLELVTDQTEYQPGDTAKIMVKSPFDQGLGLLTVERAGVRSARVFPITDNMPVLELPLTEADAPNVFVSVLLIRGRVSERLDEKGFDFGKPTMRLGYGNLSVKSDLYRYRVEVSPERTQVGPGESVNVGLKVTDSQGRPVKAELAVVAADAAVIQLTGEATYYPEKFYAQELPLTMLTLDSRLKLIGRRNYGLKGGAPAAGGGLGEGLADIRKNFASLAFFDPSVITDENGLARVTMKMPENLTAFNIYAVATGPERESGTGKSSVLVTKDLLIQSALPNYAGAGDEFTAGLVVHNRGQNEGQAHITLKGEGFALQEGQEARQTITVTAGSSREVRFKVKAGSGPRASFIFAADMGRESDTVQFTIPVSPANHLTTQASYEQVPAGTYKVIDLQLPPNIDPGRGGLTVDLAPSLISTLNEPFDWLASYPRGCIEQRTAKAMGSLIWLNLTGRVKDSPERREQARAYVKEHLRYLEQWSYDGGYTYWPGQGWHQTDPYLTAFVMEFLLGAEQAGFAEAKPLLNRSANYLSRAVKNQSWPTWLTPEAQRSASIYVLSVLSLAGENMAALVETHYLKRRELDSEELANLLLAMSRQDKTKANRQRIDELISLLDNRLSFTSGGIQVMNDRAQPSLWWSKERTMARIIMALTKVRPDHPHLVGLARQVITVRPDGGHFGSTQSNALVLFALTEFLRAAEPEAPQMTIEAILGERTITRAEFKSFTDPVEEGFAPAAELAGLKTPKLSLHPSGQGRIWSTVRLKTAPLEPDLTAETSGGFVLSRSYQKVSPEEGAQGQTVFKRGDVVKITVVMMIPNDRHWLALEDRVPAGFEPINFNLLDAQADLQRLLTGSGDAAGSGDEEGEEYDGNRAPAALHWYDHQEIWPDRVAVYSRHLPEGVFSYSYLARAVTSGRYLTPGAMAEEMYAPETYGRSSGHIITVED